MSALCFRVASGSDVADDLRSHVQPGSRTCDAGPAQDLREQGVSVMLAGLVVRVLERSTSNQRLPFAASG